MKKLSDINESHWSEMNRRSQGITVRKEDDIDLLDRNGLYDYLTSHYKNTRSFVQIYNSDTFDTIYVPFLLAYGNDDVHLDFKNNEVSIPYASPYKINGLFSKLTKEFSIRSNSDTKPSLYIISPKDGSKVTNTFFIEVIDFLINNIPNSSERGVEKIVNESHWSEMNKRSQGIKQRMEDGTNNLNRLKPVDVGCSVLWADQDLEINDNYFFKFDEIPDLIQNSKWRLPTRKDVDELAKKCEVNTWDPHHFCVIKEGDPEKSNLKFERRGMIYNTSVTHGYERPEYTMEFWGWTSEEMNDGRAIQCYIITDDGIQYTPLENTYRIVDVINTDRTAKLCIRLVKDK